jgi:hypothetical protein
MYPGLVTYARYLVVLSTDCIVCGVGRKVELVKRGNKGVFQGFP